MRRVCVVITARPSYSRILTVLRALRTRPDVELQVVAAASALVTRFGSVVNQMCSDGFIPHAEVRSVLDGDTPADSAISTGVLLQQLPGVFERLRPDVVVTIADRHETLATAISASYMNIPLCHIQGGETSGSIDGKVRYAVTSLSSIHCTATKQATTNVWRHIGEKSSVYLTGCPSIDLAREAKELGPLPGYDVVVLQHAVTNEYDQAADQMEQTVKAVEGMNACFFWPGEDAGNGAMAKVLRLAGIKAIRSLPPVDFLRTLLGSKVLVGNSSVGIRECSFLGVPVVNVGTRQNGRERHVNVINEPHEAGWIRRAIDQWLEADANSEGPAPSTLYGDGRAGERIAGILAGEKVREAVA